MSAAMPSRAHAPALRNGRPLPPRDDAVPQLSGLLRTDVMTAALSRSTTKRRYLERTDEFRIPPVYVST